MKILYLNPDPIHFVPCWVPPPSHLRNCGGPGLLSQPMAVLEATAAELPDNLDAIFLTSDLQGFTNFGGEMTLMGLALPSELALFVEIYRPEWRLDRIGAVLCGDLFALENRRGGMGDSLPVWQAFRDTFRWVAGVSGNHDIIGNENRGVAKLKFEPGIHHLDGAMAQVDGLRIGGVSGIIGPPRKFNRREAPDFLAALKKVVVKKPDLLLLHEGPDFPEKDWMGNPAIRETLEAGPPTTVVFGHDQWPEALQALPNGTQLLNVDHRVVVVSRA